jgi:Fe-S cluster biosynthesis and repair protein YggX
MTRMVFCQKLKQELPGLEQTPYPGELGQKVFENISAQAWQAWLQHQTMLINEYRLNVIDPEAREFLEKEMEKFLFGEGSEKPEGFVPPEQ